MFDVSRVVNDNEPKVDIYYRHLAAGTQGRACFGSAEEVSQIWGWRSNHSHGHPKPLGVQGSEWRRRMGGEIYDTLYYL
jgi:hypothetical protein